MNLRGGAESLNYNHLRYFWAAAREGGITRAARKLHVAQPSLSAQIHRNKPRLFDAKNNPVTDDKLKLGTGSRARITFTTYAWKSPIGCGIRLEPRAAQILEFVAYTGGSQKAEDYGFEASEGFEYQPGEEAADTGESAGTGEL